MIKIEHASVFNIGNAMRGMRNPLESWGLSDTVNDEIGPKDFTLAKKLVISGTDHSKFLRQIFVSMDITAPMTWWWDFDTYKVATVRNSTSRMHKLGTRLLTIDDFSWDDHIQGYTDFTDIRVLLLDDLNRRIEEYQRTKNARLWRSIIADLPQSYNFLSTWTGNYQNLRNIYHARKEHKQVEFREFCKFLETLPYSELFTITK
jgi:hypothetical protein